MRTIRLGVIGCGAIATTVHLRNARRLHGASVTAIADTNERSLAAAARLAPRAARYGTAEELLSRGRVDAVVVATPSQTHADIARAVLSAEKHLYLEKPVATTLDDALLLADDACRSRVVAAVGFNRRFHPVVREAVRCLAKGDLGEVVLVRSWFDEPLEASALPAWKRARQTGGGAPIDLASHHVDLARHLIGAEPIATSSEIHSHRSYADDCTLRFVAGGCTVEIACSFVRGRRDVVSLHDADGRSLVLDRYAASLTLSGRSVLRPALAVARARAVLRPLADPSYGPALRAFVARIRGADLALPTIDDGVVSLRAVLAAEGAAQSRAS